MLDWQIILVSSLIEILFILLMILSVLFFFSRPIISWIVAWVIKRLMTESYEENVWEMITASLRVKPITIIENSLRAQSGKIIERPFGSPRKFLNFDRLVFSPAQLFRFPKLGDEYVDTKVIIGPQAKKPLMIDIPIIAAGMGYGIGVSDKVKRVLAKATAALGTATNSGEGLFLFDEKILAKHWIWQYSQGFWSKDPGVIQKADAIEIRLGQGANAGSTRYLPPKFLQGEIRDKFHLSEEETLVVPSRFEEIKHPDDLKKTVEYLRELTDGVPIGVKMASSDKIEEDIEIALKAGVDFISIDGGQAGSHGSAPIFEDDFGLPTIYALSRSVQYLTKRGVKDKVSLLIGGGLNTPGECLKALALGADAVYMGSALLWTMTHDQILKTMPWEPPTQLVYYSGKMKENFDEEQAQLHLTNFLTSCIEEMKEAVRSLGKLSIKDVNSEDLVALDEMTSQITKVRLAYNKQEDH
ncbi:FMN-binding glutamate synthase family protein [Alkalihalophilus pseudofirmus]|nr:FMN-binding glutamate synthase family protein [Alkalihalophilus pseudofirmus]